MHSAQSKVPNRVTPLGSSYFVIGNTNQVTSSVWEGGVERRPVNPQTKTYRSTDDHSSRDSCCPRSCACMAHGYLVIWFERLFGLNRKTESEAPKDEYRRYNRLQSLLFC
jgi:hypothetical protein